MGNHHTKNSKTCRKQKNSRRPRASNFHLCHDRSPALQPLRRPIFPMPWPDAPLTVNRWARLARHYPCVNRGKPAVHFHRSASASLRHTAALRRRAVMLSTRRIGHCRPGIPNSVSAVPKPLPRLGAYCTSIRFITRRAPVGSKALYGPTAGTTAIRITRITWSAARRRYRRYLRFPIKIWAHPRTAADEQS